MAIRLSLIVEPAPGRGGDYNKSSFSIIWQIIHGAARIFLHSRIKNSQFLPNQDDIQVILPNHELIISTKFHNDWVKIVDFLFQLFTTCA